MQYFQDTATGQVYGYDDNVVVTIGDGGLSTVTATIVVHGTDAEGNPATAQKIIDIAAPMTLQPCSEPAPPIQTIAERALVVLASGLTITSTGTPALNATYPITDQSISDLQGEMLSVSVNGVFADGAKTVDWPDNMGVVHTFSLVQFKAFATQVAKFVALCRRVMRDNAGTLPSASITIA